MGFNVLPNNIVRLLKQKCNAVVRWSALRDLVNQLRNDQSNPDLIPVDAASKRRILSPHSSG
jgi:hypothetical protein